MRHRASWICCSRGIEKQKEPKDRMEALSNRDLTRLLPETSTRPWPTALHILVHFMSGFTWRKAPLNQILLATEFSSRPPIQRWIKRMNNENSLMLFKSVYWLSGIYKINMLFCLFSPKNCMWVIKVFLPCNGTADTLSWMIGIRRELLGVRR